MVKRMKERMGKRMERGCKPFHVHVYIHLTRMKVRKWGEEGWGGALLNDVTNNQIRLHGKGEARNYPSPRHSAGFQPPRRKQFRRRCSIFLVVFERKDGWTSIRGRKT